MLNKNSITLLIALSKLLPPAGFKIIDLSDILDNIDDVKLTAQQIKVILTDLVAKQYIVKKYIDDEEYCIAITDMALVKVAELELIELDKLTQSAILKRNAAGEMVIAVSKAGEEAYVKPPVPVVAEVIASEVEHVEAEIVNIKSRRNRKKKVKYAVDLSSDNTAIAEQNQSKIATISVKRVVSISMLSGFFGGGIGGGIIALIYFLVTTLI